MAPLRGMDFARNQLLKYGWKEGKGLGRNESGITDAIRPKLKFDTRGIGHDGSEQFTYHWWEHAFNQAARNIQVSSSEEGVQLDILDDTVDITTKKYSLKKLEKINALEYGTFLKTSTLTKGGQMTRIAPEIPDTNESDDPGPSFQNLTDEELFRICGSRTAHKGARHGIKLNGKLARIQEQEELLLAKICNDKMSESDKFINAEIKLKEKEQNEEISNVISDYEQTTVHSKKIKRKKKDKIREKCLIDFENDLLENNYPKKKKKSKRKHDDCIELQKNSKKERKCNIFLNDESKDVKRKKSKSMNVESVNVNDETLNLMVSPNDDDRNIRKKKKKNRIAANLAENN